MLVELRIRNVAVIDTVALPLSAGLNVLTGKTGAGKSLIVGALGMLLGERAATDRVRSGADKATVYRVLVKLEELGFIRRLGLHDRSTYYTLIQAGHHDDYLICTQCGRIQRLDISCPVEALEKQIEKTSGFRRLYHELEFYGLCPKCG